MRLLFALLCRTARCPALSPTAAAPWFPPRIFGSLLRRLGPERLARARVRERGFGYSRRFYLPRALPAAIPGGSVQYF